MRINEGERNRRPEKQTDKQTKRRRDGDGETERQRDRETERLTFIVPSSSPLIRQF
jgi:hypothetical protein